MADTYTIKVAENILKNRLCKTWKETFYLEGENDFKRINLDDIETQLVISEEDEKDSESEIVIEMDQLASTLINLNIPSKIKLIAYKKEFVNTRG